MKKLVLSAIVLFVATGMCAQKPKSFEKYDLDDKGHVYFEKIYNVSKREGYEIARYALQYANYKGAGLTKENIVNDEITFPYQW